MLLKQKVLDVLAGGRAGLVYKRWGRPVHGAGDLMPSPLGPLRVVSAVIVEPDALTLEDARAAGLADVPALLAAAGQETGPLYRIELRLDEEEAGEALGPKARKALRKRLDRHDRAADEPWTRALLRALAAAPGDRPRAEARNLTTLIDLGLVERTDKGYLLNGRGASFLETGAAAGRDEEQVAP